MRLMVQNYGNGEFSLAELPAPGLKRHTLLVRTANSLISVGTERYMLGFAKKSLFEKARARPDLVKQVLNKARIEGPIEAYRQAMGRLDTPVPLGYSAAGEVIEVGEDVTGFRVGDRVACSGSGIASHAEILRVPPNMVSKIPESVSYEEAAFSTLGAIALHAIRTGGSAVGERVAVLGLGLLGQIAVQLLNASGCKVFGLDLAPEKVEMALEHGARAGAVVGRDNIPSAAAQFTIGRGVDAVYIFASTSRNEPIEMAADVARDRAKIVVPGLVGLDLPRKVFYDKELQFVVSRAWGPGMYDPDYEAGRTDYPISYVRWTAERNLPEVLDLMADGRLKVGHLITHRFPFERALEAYEMILEAKEPAIGVILQYDGDASRSRTVRLHARDERKATPPIRSGVKGGKDLTPIPEVGLAMIGAGLFANGTILPALKSIKGVRRVAVATTSGVSAEHMASKGGFEYCTTDVDQILGDPEIHLLMILTRHGVHADLVCRALEAGKHVFVEKPLAISQEQMHLVIETYKRSPGRLMVGFNRRFAPTTREALSLLQGATGPLVINVRVNVGYIAPEVWVHDPKEGGGNIIGEACHFFDLIQTFTKSLPFRIFAQAVDDPEDGIIPEDNLAISLRMENGSVGSICYTTLGDKGFSRERVEIFAGGAACAIENFRRMTYISAGRRKRFGGVLSGVDRGYRTEMQYLFRCLQRGEIFPVPFEEYVATTKATFAAVESLKCGEPVTLEYEN